MIKTTNIHKTASSGFTLLEVMVAMVIFSIGLLGLAGLQSAGLRNNQLSYSTSLATQLVYDMADRMRNNNNSVVINGYATTSSGFTPTATNCVTSSCASNVMVGFDLTEWDTSITGPNSPLRNAAWFITALGGTPATFRITIGWNIAGTGVTPVLANCTSPIPAAFSCVSVETVP